LNDDDDNDSSSDAYSSDDSDNNDDDDDDDDEDEQKEKKEDQCYMSMFDLAQKDEEMYNIINDKSRACPTSEKIIHQVSFCLIYMYGFCSLQSNLFLCYNCCYLLCVFLPVQVPISCEDITLELISNVCKVHEGEYLTDEVLRYYIDMHIYNDTH
jgi:hypothetical protein